jgi:quinate dehydrogenase (quinone)
VAWTYRTGRRTAAAGAGVDENTFANRQCAVFLHAGKPGDRLDADTGKPLWKFDPHAKARNT